MLSFENCIDCPSHKIIHDPDPDDWFCDDDVAVVCQEVRHKTFDPNSKYTAQRQLHKPITVACRPYNIRKESTIPTWCPRLPKVEKNSE